MAARGFALVFPERQRCLRCRRHFGPMVILGLYCSIVCADTTPGRDIGAAPRECKKPSKATGTERWAWKAKFLTLRDVPEVHLKDPGASVYRCGHCGFLHLGHRRNQSDRYE